MKYFKQYKHVSLFILSFKMHMNLYGCEMEIFAVDTDIFLATIILMHLCQFAQDDLDIHLKQEKHKNRRAQGRRAAFCMGSSG